MQAQQISYKRHRFPPLIIAHVVWLYVRFNLSLREVEELMLERGVDASYEMIRRWTVKFGPLIAHALRRRQPRPGDVWHLDEVVVKIAGRPYWLWRAVDQNGVVLEEILQSKRDKRTAKRLLVKLMKRTTLKRTDFFSGESVRFGGSIGASRSNFGQLQVFSKCGAHQCRL